MCDADVCVLCLLWSAFVFSLGRHMHRPPSTSPLACCCWWHHLALYCVCVFTIRAAPWC
jgi:hypothetical protein